MATATMATAAGAAALLYYTLSKRLQTENSRGDKEGEDSDDGSRNASGVDRISRRQLRAPATWMETISTLSETLRFTYSETLGKWPIGDLAFGINFLLKRQDSCGRLCRGSLGLGRSQPRARASGTVCRDSGGETWPKKMVGKDSSGDCWAVSGNLQQELRTCGRRVGN
ncbi:hypothetical protein KSP40_PGU017354 [Platanthera guangdongensis]|uniref:Mono-/di-acylglycerol lipase N-terminal domain-containing protein n=1 Tax=Platanthera guangdongensis TaxID=2320717 RepID=A0ABR2LRE4_9ASPA